MNGQAQITFERQGGSETIVDTARLKAGGRIRFYGVHRDNFLQLRKNGVLWPYVFTTCNGGPGQTWTEFDVSIDPKACQLV